MGDDLTRWDQAVDRLVASLDLSGVCVGSSSASSSVSSGFATSVVDAKTESWSCSQKQEVTPTQVSCDSACTTLVAVTKESMDTPLRSQTQEIIPSQASCDTTCTTLAVVTTERKETHSTPPKRSRVCTDSKVSTRTRREKIALTLPIPAPRRFKRRCQARWKPIELSDDTHSHLHDVLTILNARNLEGRKHDIGIAHNDVLDFTPCFTVHEKRADFKLKRSVPGFTLFCAKCGRVSPIREKFQITNTSCPIRPKSTLPPRWRTNKLTDEAFLKLQNGLTELNLGNVDGLCHDLGIVIDGFADFSPCQERSQFSEGVELPKTYPGASLFCSKCARIAPIRERFQLAKTMCRSRPAVPMDDLILRSSAVRKTLSELRRKKVMLNARAKAEFTSLLRQVVMTLEASGVPVMFQSPDGQTKVGGREVFPAVYKGGATILTTLNVGCLTNKLEGLSDLGSDFIGIQEAGVVHAKTPGFHRLARALGLQLHFGPGPKSVTDAAGRRSHNKSL
eukprot:833484-Amphidinium_carterae.1